jgi:hypothetical protein
MRKVLALALFCAASLSGAAVRADEPGWPPAAPEPCKPCWIEPWLCKNPPCPPGPKRVDPDPRVGIDDGAPAPQPQPKCCRERPVQPF